MDASSLPNVTKCNGLNYQKWKFDITNALRFRKLIDCISEEGIERPPLVRGENDDFTADSKKLRSDWDAQDGMALALICMSLEEKST
jgi:hypothetical protein